MPLATWPTNWHGKRRARQLALTPSTGTLRPCPDESVDWDTTQNLMIEGDNLEVLKLLQPLEGLISPGQSAQAQVLSAQSALIGVRQRRLAAAATLLKNVAGRWEATAPAQ